MISHPRTYSAQLSLEHINVILDNSMKILEKVGIVIQSEKARKYLLDAGINVDTDNERIFFTPGLIYKYLEKVPSQWVLHARNPKRNVTIGNNSLNVAPGYGSAFIADANGKRRYAVMDDFRNFARLAGHFDCVDITGGLLVEPTDIPAAIRPAELTYALAALSDKPFMGSVLGAEGAKDSIQIARIIMGNNLDKPSVMGLININSPLRLDKHMADAMLEYVLAGQPIVLTPGILMGITAPVTAVGALSQAFAELIGITVITQIINPGTPVIMGIGGFGSDMRTGSSGFGHPEHALGTLMGAQIARGLNIPYRCSAAVTNSNVPDCQSGYERMMTALSAWNAGANFCLQAAGILDSINSMNYEQFLIDMEIWANIKRLAVPLEVNDESLAYDVIASLPADGYMAHEHTFRHFKEELFAGDLTFNGTYEKWEETGSEDIVKRAGNKAAQILKVEPVPELAPDIKKQLDEYINIRRTETGF